MNEVAAQWWADHLQRDQPVRELFRAALIGLLPDDDWMLQCDHDPDTVLRGALAAAGIECRGFMFSAAGLLPQKTVMRRDAGGLTLKHGYGAPSVRLGPFDA